MTRLSSTFKTFFKSEKTGGFLLILCTLLSIVLSNSDFGTTYTEFWHTNLGGHDISHWINDCLMSIFFLLIGLELEREVYTGELSSFKNASLPVIAALGGVIVPAMIYVIFNYNTPQLKGAGIPMATDIAFAIGVLSLLGNKVPIGLKVFLTALAVIDDLLAIIVIAVFYTNDFSVFHLMLSFLVFGILIVLNRLKINMLLPYLFGGIFLWICMYKSGIHPSLSGVLLAFAIPFGKGEKNSISYKLQHALHYPVALFIIPLFALANTCITFSPGWSEGIFNNVSIGIILGLLIGKPVGILIFSLIGIRIKICNLPEGVNKNHLLGGGVLAGIGFTMSIFITLLAFDDSATINNSKMAILFSSTLAGILGAVLLSNIKGNSTQSR
jgi:NhaA family Na+:H+ antiporter